MLGYHCSLFFLCYFITINVIFLYQKIIFLEYICKISVHKKGTTEGKGKMQQARIVLRSCLICYLLRSVYDVNKAVLLQQVLWFARAGHCVRYNRAISRMTHATSCHSYHSITRCIIIKIKEVMMDNSMKLFLLFAVCLYIFYLCDAITNYS